MAAKSNGGGELEVLRKGPWMPEEDEILVEYVNQYGPRDWSSIRSKGLLPRTGKSCRLRWVNKLKPDLKSGCKFSPEEEKLVVEMQAKLGNKWAKIASYLPGRTDNDVKNFWSTRQKRLLRALQRPKGVDSTSGVTYGGEDHFDHLGNAHCFNEFSTFQGQQQLGGGSGGFNCSGSYHAGMTPALSSDRSFKDRDLFIRGQRLMMRNPMQATSSFHNNTAMNRGAGAAPCPSSSDLFMVKLHDLLPNHAAFMDTTSVFDSATGSTSGAAAEQQAESSSSRQPAPPNSGMVSKSLRSMKNRRPRYGSCSASRAGARESGAEMVVVDGGTSAATAAFPPEEAVVADEEEEQGVFWRDLYGGDPPTTDAVDGGDYLSDLLMMNYESCCSTAPTTAASTNSTSGGRPDSPLFPDVIPCSSTDAMAMDMMSGFQWDKVPLLAAAAAPTPAEDGGGAAAELAALDRMHSHSHSSASSSMCMMIKEEPVDSSSCTPDSVLLSFPSDVFDSLEPLSPSSSDWWHK